MKLFELYFLFVKFGFFSIGGGYVLIPLYQEALINERHILTYEQFANMIAISQLTPGPIGINMATFVGYACAGFFGAILASLAIITPSLFLVPLVEHSIRRWEKNTIFQGIFDGLRPAAYGMLLIAGFIFANMSFFQNPLSADFLLNFCKKPLEVLSEIKISFSSIILALCAGYFIVKEKFSVIKILIFSAIIGAILGAI